MRWRFTLGAVALVVGCCPERIRTTEIDLGLDADLEAVIRLDPDGIDGVWLAVGEHGTIVTWNLDHHQGRKQLDVRRFDIGDQHLRAVVEEFDALWIVGDDGFAAVSDDEGATWIRLDLPAGVDADLRAIAVVESYWHNPPPPDPSRMMILGEGVVLLQQEDDSWIEVPPPAGGWGDLNVVRSGYEAFLFGDAGIAWTTLDPLDVTLPWVAVDTGSEADLIAASRGSDVFLVYAADGTVLSRNDIDGWSTSGAGIGETIVDIDNQFALAADGIIYAGLDYPTPYWSEPSFSGARAMASYGEQNTSIMVVGENGRAIEILLQDCPPW